MQSEVWNCPDNEATRAKAHASGRQWGHTNNCRSVWRERGTGGIGIAGDVIKVEGEAGHPRFSKGR